MTSAPKDWPRNEDAPTAATRLRDLQAAIRAGDAPGDQIAARLDDIALELESVVEEHAGLADELLGAYEQLGIVFELTRQLPALDRESDVIDRFVQCCRRSFDGRDVIAARRAPGSGWIDAQTEELLPDAFADLSQRTAESKRAVVEPCERGGTIGGVIETLCAPVCSADQVYYVLLLGRYASAPPFRAVDMMLVDSLSMFCGDLLRNHRLVHELRIMLLQLVRSLVSAVDQKDEYTSGHSLRVGYFATSLGKQLGLSRHDLDMLTWSALLHDVGKIGIRDEVLKKPGKLTEEEFAHIKEHPIRSYQVVSVVPQLADALDGVLYHHERYDGKGYPYGLAAEDIPEQARIIQIADIFDALTSDRAYRAAFTWEQALDILAKESGTTVDPNMQPVFDRWVRARMSAGEDMWTALLFDANSFTLLDEMEGL